MNPEEKGGRPRGFIPDDPSTIVELAEARGERKREIMGQIYELQDDFMNAISAPRLTDLGISDDRLQEEVGNIVARMHEFTTLALRLAGIERVEWKRYWTARLDGDLSQVDRDDVVS